MEQLVFINKINKDVHYIKWSVANPKCCVIISHGMAEHPERYDDLARYLNENSIAVYATYHIGHGQFADKLAHMDKGDFDRCIANLSELVDIARKENNCKVFLLGHSMGSFMAQLYICRYHNIDGLILSGSTKASFIMKAGSIAASVLSLFSKDLSKPNNLMNNLAFGSYNKVYDVVKTDFDWLNRDENEVKKYIDDKYCGWIGSTGFFYNLTHGIKQMGQAKNIKHVDKHLPIFIHGGSKDPVSNCKVGLEKLYKQYKKLGVINVSLTIYDGARHEIYNEINKAEVYKNTLDFIKNNL